MSSHAKSSGAESAAAGDLSPVKRALLEIRELRSRLHDLERARSEPIAIVGMGCRFPGGAKNPDQFWRLLSDGVDAVGEVPADRWDIDRYYDPDPGAAGRMSTRWGGFIDGMDQFDPTVFGITRREAMSMDPQQRLLLEVSWEALEHSGHAPDGLGGRSVGVFVGVSSFDYVHLAMSAPEEELSAYLAQGIAHSAASGRIAYALGVHGPAISVDTACSSSLMALHLAVQSLRSGECEMALVGGVNAILLPTFLIGFSRSQMMAADGRCKTFDARADGFVRGEGCGVLVLKRLSDALSSRDHIWAVVRGTAANQDGRSSGMTAPNGLAQQAVIRAALRDAGVHAAQVGYVEAHGTGTALGDPIEVQALGAVMREGRAADRPLLVGSVKTNVGHLEAAAGVAGVLKAALMLRHGEIPASLHFREPNPFIAWDELPVRVVGERTSFPTWDDRRIAGVSAFGFTGTNVHAVLEGPLARDISAHPPAGSAAHGAVPRERPLHLMKLSSGDESSLAALSHRWAERLESSADAFTDVAFTANVGRADLPERLVVVAADAADARAALEATSRGELPPTAARGRAVDPDRARVAMLFTGHGAQYHGMARELYETQPTFRAAMDECDALFRLHAEQPLLRVLYSEVDGDGSSLLETMSHSQPALFALQYALATLWRSWGVEPTAMLGHSVGEYAAAVVAGILSLEDGLKLVAARGQLMDSLTEPGAMIAIFATHFDVTKIIEPHAGRVCVAAINGPAEVVVSGNRDSIDTLEVELGDADIEFRRLAVAQAGHSHLLDPILEEFEQVVRTVAFRRADIPVVSCTTGDLIQPAETADSAYWTRHLRQPVQFAAGMETLRREGCRIFLEIGPHSNLVGMGRRCFPDDGELLWLPSLRRDTCDWRQLLESVAAMYVTGVRIDWDAFERDHADVPGASRRRVPLPTYAWQHRRYWLEHHLPDRTAEPPRADDAWERLLTSGREQEQRLPDDVDVESLPGRWAALDRLTTMIVAATLGKLGLAGVDGFPSSAALGGMLGVIPRYQWLLARWVQRLADARLLVVSDGRFQRVQSDIAAGRADAWGEAEREVADWPYMLDYLRRCEDLLPDVLTGKVQAVETLCPTGSSATADALYRDSVLPRYYNSLAAALVEEFAASRDGEGVRVLEVGGGVGGTTAVLAPIIQRRGGTYRFTDVWSGFVTAASTRFAEMGCMSFGELDMNNEPAMQGHEPGSFDLIVATHVLHASTDLPRAIAHLRSLLAPGGILLLGEVTTSLGWFDVSIALLEDGDRRSDRHGEEGPLPSSSQWESALREAGFDRVAMFPEPGSLSASLPQHVLVARSPRPEVGENAPASAEPALDAGPSQASAAQRAADDFTARLAASPVYERETLLIEYVRAQIARLLRLDSPASISRSARLMELGLDSLMAVELRSRLAMGLTLPEPLPATLIFDHPTVEAIVALLSSMWPDVTAGEGEIANATREAGVPSGTELNDLTDDEVEARLLSRLDAIEARLR